MNFLKNLVIRLKVDTHQKAELNKAIEELSGVDLPKEEKLITPRQNECIQHLINSVKLQYADAVGSLGHGTMRGESAYFAAAILKVEGQQPFFEISPDFDINNPLSPLLCRIIPSVASFKILLEAVHGSDHTSDPYFTVGRFSPGFIRALDETPEKFGKSRQMRPVEMIHPDVQYNDRPHGYLAYGFELTTHDLGLHCMRNSSNMIKSFNRYLRQLHDIKGYEMSKIIWDLSDMDDDIGRHMRLGKELHGIHTGYIKTLYINHRKDFFIKPDAYDDNLILIISMLVESNKWEKFLTVPPFQMMYLFCPEGSRFLEIWNALTKIVSRYAGRTLQDICMLAILAYRIRGNAQGLEAFDTLTLDNNDLNKVFYWKRNGGICFREKYVVTGEKAIEKLSPVQIVHFAVEAFRLVQKEKAEQAESVHKKEADDQVRAVRYR